LRPFGRIFVCRYSSPAHNRLGSGGLRGGSRLVGLHGKALTVEHRRLARPLAFDQGGADFCRRRSVAERSGYQPQLHAEPGIALLHHDDRPQRRQRCSRFRLEKSTPQRTQAIERIGAAHIDAEFGSLYRLLGGRRLRRIRPRTIPRLLVCDDFGLGRRYRVGLDQFSGRRIRWGHDRFRRHERHRRRRCRRI
jgi:hypothetical protein